MINNLHIDTCIDVKIHREVFLSRGVTLSAHSALIGCLQGSSPWFKTFVKKHVVLKILHCFLPCLPPFLRKGGNEVEKNGP